MTRRWAVRGLAAVAAVVFSQAMLPGAAQAADFCVSGTPMQSSTATGTLTPADDEDRWQATGYGTTEVSISASNTGFTVQVFDALCAPLCTIARGSAGRCATGASGTLHIFVFGLAPDGYGTYTLRVGSTLPVAVPPQPCTSVAVTTGCVVVSNGPPQQQVYVTGAQLGQSATHHAAGTVDLYSFPLQTGGSVTAPCVVLVTDSVTLSPCAAAGGSRVSTIAYLYDQTLDQQSATLVTVTSARVCAATYTVTVNGIGVNNLPALALC
jgi:hypothetical protein